MIWVPFVNAIRRHGGEGEEVHTMWQYMFAERALMFEDK